MGDLFNNKTAFSLFELNNIIKELSYLAYTYWVVAEIADTKLNQVDIAILSLSEKKTTRS
jgi:hypothetical protein